MGTSFLRLNYIHTTIFSTIIDFLIYDKQIAFFIDTVRRVYDPTIFYQKFSVHCSKFATK